MADTVGSVYVKVISDSKGFAKSLRAEAKRAGVDGGEAYADGFNDKIERRLRKVQIAEILDPKIKQAGKDLAQLLANVTQTGSRVKDIKFRAEDILPFSELKALADKIGVTTDQLAKHIEANIESAFKQGFASMKKDAAAAIADVVKQQRKMDRLHAKALAENIKFDKKVTEAAARELKARETQFDKYIEENIKADERRVKAEEANIKKMDRLHAKALAENIRRTKKAAEELSKLDVFSRIFRGSRRTEASLARMDRRARSLRNSFRRMGSGGAFDAITSAMGALLGTTGALSRVIDKTLGGALRGTGGLMIKFGKLLGDVGEQGSALSKITGGLGAIFTNLGAGLSSTLVSGAAGVAALAVAVSAAVSVIAVIVPLISAFVAGIVALGSVVTYAAGALALLVPLGGAFVVGFAAVAIGASDAAGAIGALFKAMNETDPKKRAKEMEKYRKELAKLGPNAKSAVQAMEPLVKAFQGLKREAGEALFAGMAASLKNAKPLLDATKDGLVLVAGAAGDVVDSFLNLGKSTKFMDSFNNMWALSATLVRDFGTAASNVFAGLTSFFSAMGPTVSLFADDIGKAAEKFRGWAESAEGQNAIATFFSNAYAVAKQVFDIIGTIGSALFNLFTAPATKEAADGLLSTLLTKAEEFKAWIDEISADGRLQQWFNDAKQVAGALWQILLAVGRAIGGLYTEENKANLLSFLGTMEKIIAVVGGFMKVMVAMFATSRFVFGGIAAFVKSLWAILKTIVEVLLIINDTSVQVFTSAKGPLQALKDGWNQVKKAVENLIAKLRSIHWPSPPAWMSGLWNKVFGASGMVVTGPTNAIIGEAGPEAVIPLTRPLGQIDPSVRAMAALLRGQGKSLGGGGRVMPGGGTMTNYFTINTPAEDPRTVATQTVNRMVARV